MYSVSETVFFSYGHRLLDYDGKCAHAHGHNARVEIRLEAEALDRRGMVADFSEIGDQVRGWVDAHLDHRMLLRRDDPLVKPLTDLGEPIFLMDVSPTAEAIAMVIFDAAALHGLPVAEVRVWETESSVATYRR
ncbi:MAG: 6-carboxytetrahydropterin synthase [Acidobacteria bacterium]|nr:6-carboxytetrahydropterin synthase [Acidobacteriota bacterium]